VTDKGITDAGIKGLTNLRSLDISGYSKISDDGLKGLSSLKSLTVMYNRQISNEGIRELKLEELYCYGSPNISPQIFGINSG